MAVAKVSYPDLSKIEEDREYSKKLQFEITLECITCFGSGKVTIYENAGFKYKGLPYEIKCPTCKHPTSLTKIGEL